MEILQLFAYIIASQLEPIEHRRLSCRLETQEPANREICFLPRSVFFASYPRVDNYAFRRQFIFDIEDHVPYISVNVHKPANLLDARIRDLDCLLGDFDLIFPGFRNISNR